MKFSPRSARSWAVGAGLLLVLGLAAIGLPRVLEHFRPAPQLDDGPPAVEMVRGQPNVMQIADVSRQKIGMRVSRVERAPNVATLRLTGWLFIDPARLVHIHARFPGEVNSLGTTTVRNGAARPLRVGDHVQRGDTLAVMWCQEVGEKKSDLVDAVSQLRLDERTLQRLRSLEGGAVAQRLIDEAERKVEADRIAFSRAERTLRSWRLTDEEIARVKAEAEQLAPARSAQPPTWENVGAWAESVVRSPITGTLLEQNVVPGDIVDTSIDMFKLADLSRLGVMAQAYEEDVRRIEGLPPDQRRWRIQIKADPAAPRIEGRFELISNLVDPTQHTTTIVGWLDNPDGALRVGQFITATIDLPGAEGEVTIPEQAAIEEGSRCFVFIAADDKAERVQRRQVALRRFEGGMAYVHATPSAAERRDGAEPIEPGELVVSNGAVELAGALTVLRVQAPPKESVRE